MSDIMLVARKEFDGFFASPAAFLFLGAFLAATLFVFFWVETFFARNIADVRPLFEWMPLLLIFLVAALTMRAWSEERRAGTLEALLTSPVPAWRLVLGKFGAGLALVAVALLLTLPLPLTVATMGDLDWGPVIGGYVAALFLAAAYIAIGLYMSVRTDNAIVALILTVATCGAFYLIGANVLTSLFGHSIGGTLALLGTGTRFESITRGVLDLRDLYYYVSIVGIFITLNVYALERLRWAGNPVTSAHWRWTWFVVLAIANFFAANLWLNSVSWARADITQGNLYSLSESTDQYLSQLREPLTIQGYFSSQTHPLLAPLVPQMKDLLTEYAVAGGRSVQVQFIDPHDDQAAEEEAASKYGIRPVPFQMADRYQTSVVSSYFDIVIAYGDQHEVLGFRDLIDVKVRGEGDLDVILKNPEYAITRSIRKVLNAYQAGGNPFDALTQNVTFTGYISEDGALPETLQSFKQELVSILAELSQKSGGKLVSEFADPDANGGALGEQLAQQYGFGPQIASLLDPRPFWFYMVLQGDSEAVQVPLPAELNRAELERSLEAAIQRLAPGFLKTVGVLRPESVGPQSKRYNTLTEVLSQTTRLKDVTLAEGVVPADVDLLLVLAPTSLETKQVFAIDQFLMRGGSVVLATSPFDASITETLSAQPNSSGLEAWLKHHGLEMDASMVLDPENASLPVPVQRYIGGIPIREIRMVPYPHFPDIRTGLNPDSVITSGLAQLTLNWASPIAVSVPPTKERTVQRLIESSPGSWRATDTNILPDYQQWPDTGFQPEEPRAQELLAVAVEGRFDSFFAGQDSPLADAGDETEAAGTEQNGGDVGARPASVVQRSPAAARIVLIGSNTFAEDSVLEIASEGLGTLYSAPIELLQNAIDWSLEDRGLLAIRSRAQFARTLAPMPQEEQASLERFNYVLAVLGLLAVAGIRFLRRKMKARRYENILAQVQQSGG